MEVSSPKLSFKEKFSYAIGQLPGSFYGSFIGQIQAFYYAWMGLSVFYIIIAQIFYGAWNMINDPIFGLLQDRTRTPKGRYLPWIKWFAPVFTIAFILIFFVPNEWRFAYSGSETQFLVFLWYLFSLCLYDLAFTIVYLALAALLPQITDNFGERTQISVLGMLCAVLGTLISGLFPLIFLTNPTESKIADFRITVLIFGILSIIPWIFLYKYVNERVELIPVKKESFIANIKYVFKNPACRVYMVYDGITVGINITVLTSITFFIAWTFGFENPYGSQTTGILGLIGYFLIPFIGGSIIGIWLQLSLPKKKDLKTLLLWDYLFMIVGFLLAFFGGLPSAEQSNSVYEVPPMLWMASIGMFFVSLGFFGNLIYLSHLNCDVVDYYEILKGNRRESIYSGINCIISKPMNSVALAVFPAILSIYGLVAASPEDPTSNALVVAHGFKNAITGVSVASFLFPAILAIIGFISFLWYPLNNEKLTEIRETLSIKHAQQRNEKNNQKSEEL